MNEFEDLIQKYLNDNVSREELQRLNSKLEDPVLRDLFKQRFKEHYHVLRAVLKSEEDIAYSKVHETIVRYRFNAMSDNKVAPKQSVSKTLVHHFKRYAAVAAVSLVLIWVMGYMFKHDRTPSVADDFALLQPMEDDIILELGDGSKTIIQPGNTGSILDARGHAVGIQKNTNIDFSDKIAYLTGEPLGYNSLQVPFGKQCEVLFADGTRVTLHSGTVLHFPLRFDQNGFREVFLEGEAFFDVAQKDITHPFIVTTRELQVKVTGTRFNVSAYPDNPTTDVMLVEGAVELLDASLEGQPAIELLPGKNASLNHLTRHIKTEQVNPEVYIGWKDDALIFRQMSFKEIEKKLERKFNIEIVNENQELAKTLFNAHFKNESIGNILRFFSESFELTYKFEGNKVYIR